MQQRGHAFRLAYLRRRRFGNVHTFFLFLLLRFLRFIIAEYRKRCRHDQYRDSGQPRYQADQREHASEYVKNERLAEHLARYILPKAVLGGRARHDNARRGGDEQRGYLCAQSVAYRREQIYVHHFVKVHTPAEQPHKYAANQIDERDDNSHDSVALDEFGRAVHRAVKICLALNIRPALPRLRFVDKAGA